MHLRNLAPRQSCVKERASHRRLLCIPVSVRSERGGVPESRHR